MTTEKFSVTGMKCVNCEKRAVNAVLAIEGVSSAEADHTADTLTVTYTGAAVSDKVVAAVSELGYTIKAGN